MTREEFARKIRWPWIIWTAGIINVTAMLPQLWKVVKTQETESLSLGMVGIYLIVQIAFALDGFFKRNLVLLVTLALSAVISITLLCVTLYIRAGG